MSDLALRPATDEDWTGILDLLLLAFHGVSREEFVATYQPLVETDRSLVVVDESTGTGEVVGHTTAYTRQLTVPGAVLPAAHVTMVAVAPTHRRQGLLRQLMCRQLAEVGEPVAVLWASEPAIYGRFGYGLASTRLFLTVESDQVRVPAPSAPSRVRLLPPATARPTLQRVYESVRTLRPGLSSRDETWWEHRVLADPPILRDGATERRIVVHEGEAGPDGYAAWRVKAQYSPSGPAGQVIVEELLASDLTAHLALWRFLLSIDLTTEVRMRRGWPGEPLLHLVDDPRRLGVRLSDGLYLRVVDLPAALTARRYQAPVEVVLEVTDPLLPANTGRWRLTGGPDGADCVRTDRPADLACDITDLGAAYLGGTSLTALAAAGRVRERRPGALAAAGAGFGWPVPPGPVDSF